jgi:type VI secretion system ImpC/EvpB family protein
MSSGSGQPDRGYAASPEGGEGALHAVDVAAESAAAGTLIDAVIRASASSTAFDAEADRPSTEPLGLLDRFLGARTVGEALAIWLGWPPGKPRDVDVGKVARMLNRQVAELDALLSRQVNAIIHHPAFQKLESSWRGLAYLIEHADEDENIKVRALNVSWKELARDAERAIEFDQSQLFRKIYGEEFGTAGGEPFGVLLGDYEICPWPSAQHPVDDLATLTAVSHVAAAAFAPFVAAIHPSLLGLNRFAGLEQPMDLGRTMGQKEFLKWRAFRDTEDSRFVGLTLPRVLMRVPYADDDSRRDGFRFEEKVARPDLGNYLWGNAAYAFGAVLMRAYAASGWLADIRGVEEGKESGGLVKGLAVDSFSTDKQGIAPKCSTDVTITERQETELSQLGFIPLCHCKDTEYSAFHASHSAQKPKEYDDAVASTNARMSSMLQYTLCVSRFAHYLKVAARDKIGAFTEAEEVEDFLHRWLQNYVTSDSQADADVKAKFPLREASVRVREHPDKPGGYICVAHLWPHLELDDLAGALRVRTELTPGRVE